MMLIDRLRKGSPSINAYTSRAEHGAALEIAALEEKIIQRVAWNADSRRSIGTARGDGECATHCSHLLAADVTNVAR